MTSFCVEADDVLYRTTSPARMALEGVNMVANPGEEIVIRGRTGRYVVTVYQSYDKTNICICPVVKARSSSH